MDQVAFCETPRAAPGPQRSVRLCGDRFPSDLAFRSPAGDWRNSRRSEAQAGEGGSRRSVSIAPTREPRRDAGPTAVARPVKKAPAEGQ
jgi:hypothetical protein